MTTLATVVLSHRVCSECGITYGIPETFIEELQRSHKTFYCPNGHSRYFPDESDLEKERRLKGYLEKRLKYEELDHQFTRNSLRSTKGAHTKTKKRIHNGVCPHCNRHFANVRRHMESQHSDL